MTEELVTLETAKLLRKKGFNEYCKNVIDINNILRETLYRINDDLPKQCFSRPTQSIAQKWLRDNHSVHTAVDVNGNGLWYCRIYDTKDYEFLFETKNYVTYEEALEAGIFEALKLI